MSKQELVLKKKKKLNIKSLQKLSSSQRLALHSVQKQLQNIQLKEWLITIGFIVGGALLRIPMQAVPSAEPITFFAILAGWLFGWRKGALTGAAAGYLSNFFMFGGQGPWSPFQMAGWALAGFLGGIIKDLKPTKSYWAYWLLAIVPLLVITIIATLGFEIVMNISSVLFLPASIFTLFLTALPFTLVHVVSNVIFASFLPFARKVVYEKGNFDEKSVCLDIINKFGGSRKLSRLLSRKAAEE